MVSGLGTLAIQKNKMVKLQVAKFAIGHRVYHKVFSYRGVVFNVDAEFCGDDRWYEEVAVSRPPKSEPWYHILPDGKRHTTYVAERNLITDESLEKIDHPLVENFFDGLNETGYISTEKFN